MSESREVDKILDELSEEFKKIKKKQDNEVIDNLKEKILKLTLDGERAVGLWTESPEFINIYSTKK